MHNTDVVELPTQIYMIDAFTAFAASALAATSIVRSIVGGILPMTGLPLYQALGYGWVSLNALFIHRSYSNMCAG